MPSAQIPVDQWADFLRKFASRHVGEHVCVELFNADEPHDEAVCERDGPLISTQSDHRVAGYAMTLRAMTIESHANGDLAVIVSTDHAEGIPAIYIVPRIAAIWTDQPQTRAGGTLRLDSRQGQSLFLRLSRPIWATAPTDTQEEEHHAHTQDR